MHLDTLQRVVAKALASGGSRHNGYSFFTYEWDIAGRCQRPHPVELYAAPSPRTGKYIFVGPGHPKPLRIILHTRCRKCDACLRQRRLLWTDRARNECSLATRTWFGTMTLKPAERTLCLARVREREARQCTDFDALAPGEQFTALHRDIGRELTKWLKRVRKASEAQLRYLLVAEAHQDGFPHYHCLIHERSGMVGERTLREKWDHGFSMFKLVHDRKEAAYVCKYLSKSARARVRASGAYGRTA